MSYCQGLRVSILRSGLNCLANGFQQLFIHSMDALKRLHRHLKQDKTLRGFIELVEQKSNLLQTMTPEQFVVSADHEILCRELENMKLTAIEQAFRQFPPLPEITAIIIKATKEFTLAFLMIPANRSFGWHDHANMNGISKCVSGEMSIRSLNPAYLQASRGSGQNVYQYPVERMRQQTLSPKGQRISIIYPDSFNVHEIHARKQSCFIDLLLPEYPDERCNYYETLQESPKDEGDVEEKIKLVKIKEAPQPVVGIESLIKVFKDHDRKKAKAKTQTIIL